ncbi:MAG: cupin domain-containing protein [Methanomicrobiaceae archaeon]|uniref:Cupin type-2 domain-containing protein n=1 Tax=hydrocarbon metagenome TaxID=938273 RepID=A0A0W8FE45_9ZZZZ|nr:cupin domain-containing protein [Methanomicrobiaceae archaeon]MDD5419208.1 cupin domain-containing protein [Methanomicrobiaceae archaeon]
MKSEKREGLEERVINPGELVPYQPGSVVSRMLVFTGAGTITLFSFDEGEGLSEHTAPYDAVITVLEGEARVTIAGIEHRLHEGDMIIMPANKPHAVHATTRFRMMLTMIHG